MISIQKDIKTVIQKIIFYTLLIILSLITLIPILLIIINSFKSQVEAAVIDLTLPKQILFSNYVEAIVRGHIIRAMLNGIFITSVALAVNIIITSMVSFILARRKTKSNQLLYNFFLLGLVSPLAIIPEIKVLQTLNLMGSYWGIIGIHIAVNIPFSILLFSGFINGIPKSLDEAGFIDGCTPLRLFFQIIFPLLKPVIFTDLIIVFMSIWNDFQYSLYFLGNQSMYTMPMTVYSFMGVHTNEMNMLCADMVLASLPVVIIFAFGQKYIISGMVAGAIKG